MFSTSRILRYACIGISVLAVLILLFINRNLAGLADLVFPGTLLWVHCGLLAVEAIAIFLFWRSVFGGRDHLLYADDLSPEGRAAFAGELARRLRDNPHVKEAGLASAGPDDPEFLEKSLAVLRKKADAEIEQNGRRIFLATALAQNGKLDAVIMFFSLCRLVWRIAALYNQKPHPREVVSLYWAVISTTFLALSLEELDITTEIGVGFGQALHAMAPAGVTASIPFAGKALHIVTNSAIDGTANCYLALRAGIITRNAFAYAFSEKRPTRAAVFREAGALLLVMSSSIMGKLGIGVADAVTGTVRSAQTKTVEAGKGIVRTIGAGIGLTSRRRPE